MGTSLFNESNSIPDNSMDMEKMISLISNSTVQENLKNKIACCAIHDLKNIISCIMGYASLITTAKNEKTLENISSSIKAAAMQASYSSEYIMSILNDNNLKKSPVNINEIIKKATEIFLGSANTNIIINTDLPDKRKCVVNADSHLIKNVFINLFKNAQHAMPNGGTITIKSHIVFVDQKKCLALKGNIKKGEYLKVDICDTGTGIPQNIINSIFKPFYTTKQDKGTGLGLASVLQTIIKHGGALDVESKMGKGTKFTLYFPNPSYAA